MINNKIVRNIIIGVFICAALFLSGYWVGVKQSDSVDPIVSTKVIYKTTTDTVPKLVGSKTLYSYKYLFKKSPIIHDSITQTIIQHDTNAMDSVQIPISQNVYKGRNYTAYVSGFHQNLDSIKVTEKIVTNTVIKKRSHWNIGISAGYAATYKGFTPYIGAGVVYNLFR